MVDHALKETVIQDLDTYLRPYKDQSFYAIYYKGVRLTITKSRMYKHAARAKVELISLVYRTVAYAINGNQVYTHPRFVDRVKLKGIARELVDELIKDGLIEIKSL